MEPAHFVVDPSDPRAPSQEIWDRMTEDQRRRLVRLAKRLRELGVDPDEIE